MGDKGKERSESVVDKKGIFAEEYIGEDREYIGVWVKHKDSKKRDKGSEKDDHHRHRQSHHHHHHHHHHQGQHRHHHHHHHHYGEHHHRTRPSGEERGEEVPTQALEMTPAGGNQNASGSNRATTRIADEQEAATNQEQPENMIIVEFDE